MVPQDYQQQELSRARYCSFGGHLGVLKETYQRVLHNVFWPAHDPPRLFKEKWLSESSVKEYNVLDYVNTFCECLNHTFPENLENAQTKIKSI